MGILLSQFECTINGQGRHLGQWSKRRQTYSLTKNDEEKTSTLALAWRYQNERDEHSLHALYLRSAHVG